MRRTLKQRLNDAAFPGRKKRRQPSLSPLAIEVLNLTRDQRDNLEMIQRDPDLVECLDLNELQPLVPVCRLSRRFIWSTLVIDRVEWMETMAGS